MKIKPVILCGGAGTRLWSKSISKVPKQFVDFGGWSLFQKTLFRINNKIFDYPIISTNSFYLNLVRKYLTKFNVKKYKIILEPFKKNTAPAILSSVLFKEIDPNQPLIFFPSDHLIEKENNFIKSINFYKKFLDDKNIFIFGIKPSFPSSQYGYFLTKKKSPNLYKVTKFIEKPNTNKAKKIIKKEGYWNSGILLAKKSSIINNFKKYQNKNYNLCLRSFINSKSNKNICYLNKRLFKKIKEISFDYAILERSKNINAIKLSIPWSDLGSWKEISKIFKNNKLKYIKKKNIFKRPWGKYINLFYGKGFLVKELIINPKSSISLQKHKHRSEHWMITDGKPKITINNNKFFSKPDDTIYIPQGAIHRIENIFKKPVKIIEVQTGSILRETDIIRFKDIYGRIK